jgi:hypothetical protein
MKMKDRLKNIAQYAGSGQTDNVQGPGTKTTYNTDEKTQIKMIRNMTPNVWLNRFLNPGTLYKQETPKENIIDDSMYKQMRKELEEKSIR